MSYFKIRLPNLKIGHLYIKKPHFIKNKKNDFDFKLNFLYK